jgi:phosphoglycerate dehydrogenase-like enzyme
MILAITRGIEESVRRRGERAWLFKEIRSKLVELTGSTLGIVGYGSIGRAVADRLRAFGMRILAFDLEKPSELGAADEFRGPGELKTLLADSDYVVVTVPYTLDNVALIGAEEIAVMKPSAILVGVSRGAIIDQKALASALRGGRLKAAALDVFDPEPLPAESELWDLENLLITAHVAGGSQLEGKHLLEISTENLERFLEGRFPLRNQVDKARGF